jgi:hypothetical protein
MTVTNSQVQVAARCWLSSGDDDEKGKTSILVLFITSNEEE